jgi:hypothetical protein
VTSWGFSGGQPPFTRLGNPKLPFWAEKPLTRVSEHFFSNSPLASHTIFKVDFNIRSRGASVSLIFQFNRSLPPRTLSFSISKPQRHHSYLRRKEQLLHRSPILKSDTLGLSSKVNSHHCDACGLLKSKYR